MKSIDKVYPDGTVALKKVNLEIKGGEILGLLGENGAGKTTLMKILSGLIQQTSGDLVVNRKPVKLKHPVDGLKLGIGMVYQHFTLVPNYTALENIILGQEDIKNFTDIISPVRLENAKKRIDEMIKRTGLVVPLDVQVESLCLGIQQRVEILKVLYKGVNVLILDEPSSFLTPKEVGELFAIIRSLKKEGKSVIFITHKLKEVLEITDRIVVLREGSVVGELPTSQASPETLALMMVGKEIVTHTAVESKTGEREILRVRNLKVENDFGVLAVDDVSFTVLEGEIFAIAGVEGNGQAEIVEALTGLRKVKDGHILIDGIEAANKSPLELFRNGLAHIPADRHKYGLVLDFTISENMILGRQWEPEFISQFSRLNLSRIRNFTSKTMEDFNIIAQSLDTPARSLSGGNQQRLIVGRELTKGNLKLIVASHPTRGLDFASTSYMHDLLIKMRNEGKAVLIVSADLDEIMSLSDRIAIMYEGEFLDIKRKGEATKEEIGLIMGGINPKDLPTIF
jgi:simple sugar transport system ATP-binding protein